MSQSSSHRPVKVGIIGCGAISHTYLKGLKTFPILETVHLADLDPERARAQAEAYGIGRHSGPEELLANPEVEIVINLTIPKVHAEVNLAALGAGKHVYCEKPFSITRAEGLPVIERAKELGLRLGSASDTFLGSAHQTCRKLIDDGAIGRPLSAVAFMATHGVETWHPNPTFYYDIGGGPMFDMGPYYLTALVNMIGPMRRVSGSTGVGFAERLVTSQPLAGTRIAVKTPTHLAGTIDFANGAIATVMMSFDIWSTHLPRIEVYGTEGTLSVPDPNGTVGQVLLKRSEHREWRDMPLTHTEMATRGAGVADMAYAIRSGRPHRASGELAYHVVDAMQAFEESSVSEHHVALSSPCCQPAAIPPGLAKGTLDE